MPFQGNSFIRNQNFIRDRDLGPPDSTISADKVDDEIDNVGAGLTVVKTQAATAESKADLAQSAIDAHAARTDDPHGAGVQAVATLRGGVATAYDTLKKVADKLTALVIGDVAGLPAALDAKLDDAQATPAGLAVLGAANPAAQRASLVATGNLFKISYVTTVGANVHTYDPETKFAEVEIVGGGGGGGGARGGASAANVAAGPGGGGGGYCTKLIDVAAIIGNPGARQASITIGVAGAGVTDGAGTSGGASLYDDGTHNLSAGGGVGGGRSGLTSGHSMLGPPNVSATATGGDVNVDGEQGGLSILQGGNVDGERRILTGQGGSSPFGRGGRRERQSATGTSAFTFTGNNGVGYGSGGSGGGVIGTGFARRGGDGTSGICVITEYR